MAPLQSNRIEGCRASIMMFCALLASILIYTTTGFLHLPSRCRNMHVSCADNIELFASSSVKVSKSSASVEKGDNTTAKEFDQTAKVSMDTGSLDMESNVLQSKAEPGTDNRDPVMVDDERKDTINDMKQADENGAPLLGRAAPTEESLSSAGTISTSSSSSLSSDSLPAMKALNKMKKHKEPTSFGERMRTASQRAERLKLESKLDKLDAELISIEQTIAALDANDRILEMLINEEITVDDMVNPEKEIEGVSTVDVRMLLRIGELTTYAETGETQKYFRELLEELLSHEDLQEVRAELNKYIDDEKMIS